MLSFYVSIGSQVHFNEYTRGTRPITPSNIKERSETILDQYGKTGSLYPHNVVLVPLGDDFMYYEVIFKKRLNTHNLSYNMFKSNESMKKNDPKN